MATRTKHHVTSLLTVLVIVFTSLFTSPGSAQAVTGADFDPGFIISDEVFFDSSSMTTAAVQSFLNSKVTSCLAGYTCLKNYKQPTPNMPAVAGYCAGFSGSSSESAASIIVKVSQACGINPQVILVLLQKEQSLVTDDWPIAIQYQKATGFSCPDTAPCDPAYSGFFNQVYGAAFQFRNYQNNPRDYNYDEGRFNTIHFNPNANCGATNVYIRNQATANLYIYTPYQPNAAALANLYGIGDGCSAYGNRNFWRIFNNWFGATILGYQYSITRLHLNVGGVAGRLGAPTTGFIEITSNGGGWVQGYSSGAITYTTSLGAAIVEGELRAQYNTRYGGIAGSLGWPATSASTVTANGGGKVQGFQHGALTLQTGATNAVKLTGGLRSAYAILGGLGGKLGWPKGDAACEANGCQQQFVNGYIYMKTAASGVPLMGAFSTKYLALGATSSVLGWPTQSPVAVAVAVAGGGVIQAFESGVLVQPTNGSPVALTGAIRSHFNALGGLSSKFGWPTQDAVCTDVECSQVFQGGTISCTNSGTCTPALPTTPSSAIDQAYNAAGVPAQLGAATTGYLNVASNGGGVVRGYQRGAIAWSETRGAFILTGGMRSAFNSFGGIGGSLGWPSGAQLCKTDLSACSQRFQGGTLTWSAKNGGRIVGAELDATFRAQGDAQGALGAATTAVIAFSNNGGGLVQAFDGGAITRAQTASVAYFLSGPIRTAYNAAGGLSGSLGWPTSDQICATDGTSCSQQFQHGTISWSATGGATVTPS